MTDQPAASDPNANEALAPTTDNGRGGTQHLLVGGAALATMAFVLGLWVMRGGSLGMLLGDEPAVAVSNPATPTASLPTAAREPQVVASTALVPAPAAIDDVRQGGETVGQRGQPVAIAPNGVPVFTAPHGVINPLTMLHDPAYYQQWGRVGATYINPLAYQQIMFQMLRHSMQAWGMGPPVTVSVDAKGTPRG